MISFIAGIWAGFARAGDDPDLPEPEPNDPDDLLINGMFEPPEFAGQYIWNENDLLLYSNLPTDDEFISPYYPTVYWKMPPATEFNDEFVAGGHYLVRGTSPNFDTSDHYSGVQASFKYRVVDEFGENDYSIGYAGIRYYNNQLFTGSFKIPEDWNGTDALLFVTDANAYRYPYTLLSIKKWTIDSDEMLGINSFDSSLAPNKIVQDGLIVKVNPDSGTLPDLSWGTDPDTRFLPSRTYTMQGTGVFAGALTGSECEFEFGYMDGYGSETFITDGSSCDIVVNESNIDGWSGTFTISEDWQGVYNTGYTLRMKFNCTSTPFPVWVESIKLVADPDELLDGSTFVDGDSPDPHYKSSTVFVIENQGETIPFPLAPFNTPANEEFVAGGEYTIKLTSTIASMSSPDSFVVEVGHIVAGTPTFTGASGFTIDSSATNFTGNVVIPILWNGTDQLVLRVRELGTILTYYSVYIYSIKVAA